MTDTTIVSTKIVILDKTGTKILTTTRGPRLYARAFILASGEMLVWGKPNPSMLCEVYELQRINRNLTKGVIKRNVAQWDRDELAMYVRFEVAA